MPIPKEVQPEPLLLPPMLLAPTTGLDAPEGGPWDFNSTLVKAFRLCSCIVAFRFWVAASVGKVNTFGRVPLEN
jgi:hypothetical protein